MKIAAIIVTCNRKKMICELLEDFMCQSRKPEGIIVIDNGSEDGTAEHVKVRFPFVQLIELESNSGQYGGQEVGVRNALQQEYDAFWLVDDDARLGEDAVKNLLNAVELNEDLREAVIWSANIIPEGQFFTEPVCIRVEDEWKIYHEFLPEFKDKIYETNGGPNIGVFVPRIIYDKIGPPRGDMVFLGEGEFIYRVRKAGFKMFRCFSSVLYHKRHIFFKVNLPGKKGFVCKTTPWHTYYEMRNRIFVDMAYGQRAIHKSLYSTVIDSMVKMYICDNKISTAVYILRAVYDGFSGKLGVRVHIPRLMDNK